MKTTIKMNLRTLLSRNSSELSASRADRLFKAGKRASDAFVLNLERQVEEMEEAIETCFDNMIASTDTNAGMKALESSEVENFVNEIHSLSEKLEILERRLKIARKINEALTEDSSK